MKLARFFNSLLRLEITSADVFKTLEMMNRAGIEVDDVRYCSDLTMEVTIKSKNHKKARKIMNRKGDSYKILAKYGAVWVLKSMAKRPLLTCGFAFLLLLALYLPSRIFVVDVEGNQCVESRYILETAAECGLRFGALGRDVRSEKLKNALLAEIPELKWVGINTNGSKAIISVKEKSTVNKQADTLRVSEIVAATDGIVMENTVLQGAPLCKIGDAVVKGQVLISGDVDCGSITKKCDAQGEIFAYTIRNLDVVSVMEHLNRREATNEKTNFSVIIGKKQIKFYKDSGISDSTCVKMKKEYPVELPGGLKIPVTFIVEHIYEYKTDVEISSGDEPKWLVEYSSRYLKSQMVAGSILSKNVQLSSAENATYLNASYRCYEMIGRAKYEESMK